MQLYTVQQVADLMSVKVRVVDTLIRRGQIPYVDVCASPLGRRPRKRIREDDLLHFLETRRVTPPPRAMRASRRLQAMQALEAADKLR